MARPTKATPERVAAILADLEAGCTRKAAALANGVSEDAFARWLRRKAGFADSVSRAEAVAERGMTQIVQRAAIKGDAKSAQWWLTRRRREDYGDQVRQEIAGAAGAPLITEVVVHLQQETDGDRDG